MPSNFYCFICEKYFPRQYNLLRHNRGVHSKEKPEKCKLCNATFSLPHQLKRHMKIHEKYTCYFCQSVFASSLDFKNHLATVHDHKNFSCKVCEKSFNSYVSLKNHKRLFHMPSPKYICPICNSCFSSWKILKCHDLLEHAEKTCSVCHEVFSDHLALKKHKRKHIQTKEIKCPECSKLLSSIYSLKVHRSTVHFNTKLYVCKICAKKFGHKHLLTKHEKKCLPQESIKDSEDL